MNNTPRQAPLVIFRVLANNAGTPAGLLMDVGDGDQGALPRLFETVHFLGLNRELACYYRDAIAPAPAAALASGGWKLLLPGALQREDERLVKEQIPADTLLIEGDWYMGAPPRPNGAQAASRALSLQLAQLVAADAHTRMKAILALMQILYANDHLNQFLETPRPPATGQPFRYLARLPSG